MTALPLPLTRDAETRPEPSGMIRNPRTYVVVQATIGSLGVLLAVTYLFSTPSPHSDWALLAGSAVLIGLCVYTIVRTLRAGRVPIAPWTNRFTDQQWWTLKGVVFAGFLAWALFIVFERFR